jgi:voltage-gated potassium channel
MAESLDRRAYGADAASRRELRRFLRRLSLLGLVLLGVTLVGTFGFVVIEGTSVGYGLVWTLDTIATVGSIPDPGDVGGHILKTVLEIVGVGTLFYALVTVAESFVAGHIGDLLDERRTLKMIDALTDHYIICGFGRVGRQIARDLSAANVRYVVIDQNPANRELARGIGTRFLEGRPSDDEVLRQAGIMRARAIMACVDSDAENIFTTLSARGLRSDVTIVARAASEDSEKKLLRAGADRIVSPYKASGAEMARIGLHPQIAGVVDVAPEYRLEEIVVTAGCAGAGQTIEQIRGGSVIVAVRRADGTLEPQPPAETVLGAGDVLVALGTPTTLERLERLFEPSANGATA